MSPLCIIGNLLSCFGAKNCCLLYNNFHFIEFIFFGGIQVGSGIGVEEHEERKDL